MANRWFEMYQYRQALVRMHLDESDRSVAMEELGWKPPVHGRWSLTVRFTATQNHYGARAGPAACPAFPLGTDRCLYWAGPLLSGYGKPVHQLRIQPIILRIHP